jgi:hypothetical protein
MHGSPKIGEATLVRKTGTVKFKSFAGRITFKAKVRRMAALRC